MLTAVQLPSSMAYVPWDGDVAAVHTIFILKPKHLHTALDRLSFGYPNVSHESALTVCCYVGEECVTCEVSINTSKVDHVAARIFDCLPVNLQENSSSRQAYQFERQQQNRQQALCLITHVDIVCQSNMILHT